MAEAKKTKRARGKRVGIKLMEETYLPAANTAFKGVRDMAEKRLRLRKQSVGKHMEDELDYKDVRTRLAKMINVAHTKKELARKLLVEAGKHRRKAIEVAKVLQIVPLDLDPYCDDNLEDNPDSRATFGVGTKSHSRSYMSGDEGDWTHDMKRAVIAAMWLQKEHLDLLEVDHWRQHFQKEVTRAITMEECVEKIDKASAKAEELKALIQENDSDNATEDKGD